MHRILIGILLINNLLSNGIDNNPYLESRIRLFEEWMNTQMDYLSLNGVSVGIVHNQELIYFKGFGYADVDNQILADEHTNYRIASITKLFTSIALMKLVEEGLIKLNDPVTKYIPELYNIQTKGYDVEKITIKSIMRHTTGLPGNVNYMWDKKNIEEPISTDEALLRLSKQSMIFKPNRIFKYSNLQLGIGQNNESIFNIPKGSKDFGKKIAAYYFWLFPNMMFNFYPWGLSINIVIPLGSEKTKIKFLSYIWDETKLNVGAGANLDKVELEDEEIVEQVQKGVKSRYYNRGQFSPTMERGVHHFHLLLSNFI